MPDSSKITSFTLEQNRAHIQRSFSLMVKVAGSLCNLHCSYCYYRDKEKTDQEKSTSQSRFCMSEEVLDTVIHQYIDSQPQEKIEFIWHGGEPTLLGVDYFKHIVSLQKKYAQGKIIINSLQTNGTLIDDEWAEFLSENHFLCGLSVDGPQEFHDRHRTTADGKGSWEKVANAAKLFNKYETEFNILAVVNASNATEPLKVYHFLKSLGSRFIQLTPIVEFRTVDGQLVNHHHGMVSPFAENVDAEAWGLFLCRIFDEWVRCDVGEIFVNIFDNTLSGYVHQSVGLCSMAKYCATGLVVTHLGDVYSCDHFIAPSYRLGNVMDNNLMDLAKGDQQLFFEEDKYMYLSGECQSCVYFNICGGDCPKNRFSFTEKGVCKSLLCEGFKKFFHHSKTYFEWMANEWMHQRPPSNIIAMLENKRNESEIINETKT